MQHIPQGDWITKGGEAARSQLGRGAANADPFYQEAGSGNDGKMEQSGCKM